MSGEKALLDDEAHVVLADGNTYTIAALTLDEVIEAESLTAALSSGTAKQARDAAATVLGYALRRRHPDVAADQIGRELISLRNLGRVLRAIFVVSGMITEGEAKAGQD